MLTPDLTRTRGDGTWDAVVEPSSEPYPVTREDWWEPEGAALLGVLVALGLLVVLTIAVAVAGAMTGGNL